MPVWNSEKTIGSAIQSLIDQTYNNFELIIVDDGSTDKTVEIINKFKDDRIKLYVDGENKRIAARRNQAIDLSNGKYIAIMDSDDIAYPQKLEMQVNYLESNPNVDLVGTKAIMFDDTGNVIGSIAVSESHEEICSKPWKGFNLVHPSWLGKATWFRKYKYSIPDIVRVEDQDLLVRSYKDSHFANINKFLLGYRSTPLNIRNISKKIALTKIRLSRSLFKHYTSNGEITKAIFSVLMQWTKVGIYYIAYIFHIETILLSHLYKNVDEKDIREWKLVWKQSNIY